MKRLLHLMMSIFLMTVSSLKPFPQECLITSSKKPTVPLLELLSVCSISHDGTLKDIIAATQQEQPQGFLRPRGKERWHLSSYLSARENAIYHHCNTLNMIQEVRPTKKSYDAALLHGGNIEGIRRRLAYLIQLWQEGVRWKQLIILTGKRPLDPVLESEATWYNVNNGLLTLKPTWQLQQKPLTESDMIRMVIAQSLLPEVWSTLPVIIIDTPLQQSTHGLVRPTTADTVRQWLSTMQSSTGSFLAISSQPFVGYQDAIVKTIVPSSFDIETVGPEAATELTKPEILVDTVARWLYNAHHLF